MSEVEADVQPLEWLFSRLFKPLFFHADVLAFSDGHVSNSTLQNWSNRKHLKPKIVGGKRLYTPADVAQVVLAEHLSRSLGVMPESGHLMVTSALLVLQRKFKAKELDDLRHLMFAYEDIADTPTMFDARKAQRDLFENGAAFFVIPMARLLDDLARKQIKRIKLNERIFGRPWEDLLEKPRRKRAGKAKA
jgi:hypothetical protein